MRKLAQQWVKRRYNRNAYDLRRCNPTTSRPPSPPLQRRWNDLCQSARQRGLPLSIDKPYVLLLAKMQCHYCRVRHCPDDPWDAGGIDRYDNSLSYDYYNSVPCCAHCNHMKWVHSASDFVQLATNVAIHSCGMMAAAPLRYLPDSRAKSVATYNTYKNDKIRRGREFDLSEPQYYALTSMSCTYCGIAECRGIDRVDNSKGYLIENCAPCCKFCNRLKCDRPLDTFLQHCLVVATHSAHLLLQRNDSRWSLILNH